MILNILNELASTSSRKEKENILRENIDNDLLIEVLESALHPRVQYYIEKIPEYNPSKETRNSSLEWGLSQLFFLSTRKVTGHDAIEFLKVVLENVSPDDAEVIIRVVKKDLRCGVGVSTVNSVWTGLIPETPYCRCSSLNKMKKNDINVGYYCQLKLDGSFINIDIHGGGVFEYSTRNGSIYDSKFFVNISNDLAKTGLEGVQLHGEALIRYNGQILPREEGNGMLNSIQSGEELADGYEIVVVLWDIIPTSVAVPKGKYDVPYSERYELLVTKIPHTQYVSIVQTKILFKVEHIKEFYKQVRELGHEGLVIKAPYMKWKDGTSTEQFKLKAEVIVELEAYALTEGEGKNAKTFGSISMRSSDELVLVDVSGISDAMRKYIFDNWSLVRGKIFSVKANGLISNKKVEGKYSLYLPRVVEIRNDKVLANSYQEIVDEFESSLDKIEFPF